MSDFFSSEEMATMNTQLLQAMSDAQGKLAIPHVPMGNLAMENTPIPVPGVVLQLLLGAMQKAMIQNATILLLENTLNAIVSNLPEEQQAAIKEHLQTVTDENVEQIKVNAAKAKDEANKQAQRNKIQLPSGTPPNLRGNGRI